MAGESINELNIMLGIDAAGVRRGFATAAEEARHFQKQLEKLQYESSKKIPKMYGPDATQFKTERDRRAKEEAEYNQRMAVEQAQTERRLAEETFQRNLRHIQKLHDRQMELAALRQNIIERYAQQEASARQAAINTGIRFGAGAVANAPGMTSAQQMDAEIAARKAEAVNFSDVLRGQMEAERRIRRAARLDRKEQDRIANMEALDELRRSNNARTREHLDQSVREARIAQERTDNILRTIRRQEFQARQDREQVAARDARRVNDANVADARRIIEQNRTATERYSVALTRLNQLLHTNNTVTGRALLTTAQYTREKTRLTIATIRQQQAQQNLNNHVNQGADIARIMTGVMGQASFAAEDFIQGVAFGDIRTALLGASNNVTMVVRGLIQAGNASGGLAAGLAGIWGWLIAIPAAAAGALAAFNWANYATRDVRDLNQALQDAVIGLGIFEVNTRIMRTEMQFKAQLRTLESTKAIDEARLRLLDEQTAKERELENLKRKTNLEAQAFVDNILGGVEARIELERQINSTIALGDAEEVAAAQRMKELIGDATEAARQGNAERLINDMREIHALLDEGALRDWTEWIGDLTAFDALQRLYNPNLSGIFLKNMGEHTERLNEIRRLLEGASNELTAAEKEQLLIEEQLLNLAIKRAELFEKEQRAKLDESEKAFELLRLRQEEAVFQIKATDAQRELLAIQKEMQALFGPQMIAAPFDIMGQLQNAVVQAEMVAFLKAKEAAVLKDMQSNMPDAKGALEQNAFTAQAQAFEQMMKKPDEKTRMQLELLAGIRDGINKLVNGEGVQIVRVGNGN